jgi:hypothetical protein
MAIVLKEWTKEEMSSIIHFLLAKKGFMAQETRIFDQRTQSSSFVQQCLTSQCCRNCESLKLLGLGNSSTSTIPS